MASQLDTPTLETRRTRSADGTLIAYHVTESPAALESRPDDVPVIVLAAGLGGHHAAWLPQIHYLSDRFRFLTWDYRGLFGSAFPTGGGPDAFHLDRQLSDLQAVLEAEGVDRFAIAGWSMGVQVALEAYRAMPERLTSMVFINGTAGRPLDAVSAIPGLGRLLGRLVGLTAYGRHVVGAATRKPARRKRVAAMLRRLGFVGPSVDEELFEQLVAEVAELNTTAYAHTLRAVAEHDASALLPEVGVPTLVIAGEHDPFNPPAVAQQMARHLPRSEIFLVRGGRHYVCLEFAELINLRLERFFQDVGLC